MPVPGVPGGRGRGRGGGHGGRGRGYQTCLADPAPRKHPMYKTKSYHRLNGKQSPPPVARLEYIIIRERHFMQYNRLVHLTCDLFAGGVGNIITKTDVGVSMQIDCVYAVYIRNWEPLSWAMFGELVEVLNCLGPRNLWLQMLLPLDYH